MVHFNSLYDFAYGQAGLFEAALKDLNGKAKGLMVEALYDTLALLSESTATFRLNDGKLVNLEDDDCCDCGGVPDAKLAQQALLNRRAFKKLALRAESLIEAENEGDPCRDCQISDLCQASGALCSPNNRSFEQLGALLSAADAIQEHAWKHLRAESCPYEIAELILVETMIAGRYLRMSEDFSISNCGEKRIADFERIGERRDMIGGEIEDLLLALSEKYSLEPAVMVLDVTAVEEDIDC